MRSAQHVSRWRLPVCEDFKTLPSPPPHVSLRYLNEFVGKLHCAPELLRHGLYPDAKEVTESMALFNAVRRYIHPTDTLQHATDKHDGIVVVGDGNTPRTAAMFAYRMPGWKCYSVDPAMDQGLSERTKGWADVSNLVTIRNKIENVRIALNRAIVVLVHAHVTLEQALRAVQAQQVCGVVTMPCCNWYGLQETLFDREPDLVYDDFSVLSDHREIRLWVNDRAGHQRNSIDPLQRNWSSASSVLKGCIRKELVASEDLVSKVTTATNSKKGRLRQDGVLDFIHEIWWEHSDHVVSVECPTTEEFCTDRVRSAIASQLGTDTFILVLEWAFRHSTVHWLLQEGYTNVYLLFLAEKQSMVVQNNSGITTLNFQLYKATKDVNSGADQETLRFEPCGSFLLQSSFAVPKSGDQGQDEETIIVSYENDGQLPPPLACIVDMGALFRGFRRRPKQKPRFFRQVYRTFHQFVTLCCPDPPAETPSLVCVTPRKQWRKRAFLAHADLGYDVHSFIATKKQNFIDPVCLFCCYKRVMHSSSTVDANNSEVRQDDSDARDATLKTWGEQAKTLQERQSKLIIDGNLVLVNTLAAWGKAARGQEQAEAEARVTHSEVKKSYVQVTGSLTRVRRFSTGMAFLSLKLEHHKEDRLLQVFLQKEAMGLSLSAFVQVARLLRKGDEVVAVGFMARNAHGHLMLQVEAISLARTGKYEAYD